MTSRVWAKQLAAACAKLPEVGCEEKHLPANQAALVERPSQLRQRLLQLLVRSIRPSPHPAPPAASANETKQHERHHISHVERVLGRRTSYMRGWATLEKKKGWPTMCASCCVLAF